MKLFHSIILSTALLLSASAFAAKLNVNTASAEQISTSMSGIGDSKAKAIVEYRKTHGKFKSIHDLENVDGIGSKTVEKNKANIIL